MGAKKPIEYYIDENGCHICTSHARNQDGYVRIMRNGKRTRLHRLVYEEKYGEIPDGLEVRHKCDNRACFNIEHLELGTHRDNINDMLVRDRSPRGENRVTSKLTEVEVVEIRSMTDIPSNILAEMYGVSTSLISDIRLLKAWKHVGGVRSQRRNAESVNGDLAWCSSHKKYLPVAEFHKNKGRKNGLSNICKSCTRDAHIRRKEDRRELL